MPIRAEDLVKQATPFIEYKKDKKSKIAYLTLNRPDHYNATTVGMRLLYGDLIHRANIDDDVKVLVARGAGDHFGTGGDLDEQNQAYTEGADVSLLHEFEIDDPDVKYPEKHSFRYIHGLCEHYSKARGGCRSLQEFKKISIVEAKGYCYGWHFYQTGDADLVVSSEDALFGHPAFRYVGVAPRLWTWIETMGLRKFQEMLFTGRPFTAKEMKMVSAAPRAVPAPPDGASAPRAGRLDPVGARQGGPLAGVRVLELTKVWAGPYAGKLLALLGAEVIRVESWDSIDATRRFGTKDVNEAPGFQAINPGKRSVQLNTRTEEGRRLLSELIVRSDIVIENLRPGAAERMGLGYGGLRALRPDIIAISMSMHGHDGPLAYQSGYAPCFSALAGICELVGYGDGPPRLLNIRYGDSSFGTAAAFAAVVALCHRRASGLGQYVDVSAVESLTALLGDCFLEYALTGHTPTRDGNEHPEMAPHGTYPCLEEEWLSLAVATDAQWHALCAAMGRSDLARDPGFADLRSRHDHGAELDGIVAAWTRGEHAGELATRLSRQGIAAYKSLSSLDLVSDESLWRRDFFPSVTDWRQRSTAIVGAPWRFSVTPATIERAAPMLGQDNDYVLGELLGLTRAERQRLVNEKVVY